MSALERIEHNLFDLYPYEDRNFLKSKARLLLDEYGPNLILELGTIKTIYIAPGDLSCRVYELPYLLRSGQAPADIYPALQRDWKEIAKLSRNNQHLDYLDPEYADLDTELVGLMAGTFFTYVKLQDREKTVLVEGVTQEPQRPRP